ncbi:hypothetical protein Tco_0333666, partial [Tanacetum coccineum]
RQKSYADLKRKPMEFQVRDKVMLKVSPWERVVHFGKRGKLNPSVMPVEIVGREVKRLKRSRIPLVKVRWNSKRGPEFFTWEREDQFKKKYPHLFTKTTPSSSAASAHLTGEVYNTLCFRVIDDVDKSTMYLFVLYAFALNH